MIGSINELEKVLPVYEIDELIVAPEVAERPRLLDLLSRCELLGNSYSVRLHPDLAELYVGRVELSQLAGLPLIGVPDRCRAGLHLSM